MDEKFFRYPAWGDLYFHCVQTSSVAHVASYLVGIGGYQDVILLPKCLPSPPPPPGTVALKRTKTDPHILTSFTIRDIEQLSQRIYDQRSQTVALQILTKSIIIDIKRLYNRSLRAV
jgi:hypothetical protein